MINQPTTFRLPWGVLLKTMTAFTAFVLIGVCLVGFFYRAVVLTFLDRVIVVTPDDPEAFAASIVTLKGL